MGRPPINRADRAEQETQTRRRRNDGVIDGMQDLKLAVPDEVRQQYPEREFALRWANDVGARIHNLTVRDDWDKVPGVDHRPVGSDDKGKPIMAVLLAKKREFQDEDNARKEDRRRDLELGALKGAASDNRDDTDARHRYAPEGNRISSSAAFQP